MREEIGHVLRERAEDLLLHRLRDAALRGAERLLERIEGAGLGFLAIRTERALAAHGIRPAGGYDHDLVVQARGPVAVEREPPEDDDSGDGVIRLPDASA